MNSRKHSRSLDDVIIRFNKLDIIDRNKKKREDVNDKLEQLLNIIMEFKTSIDIKMKSLNKQINDVSVNINYIRELVAPITNECTYIS
jgi:hypothetical protein